MSHYGTGKFAAVVLAIAAVVGGWELAAQERSPRPAATRVAAQVQPQPAALAPGDVDLDRSRVYILVGKTGLGHEHGVVGQLESGQILLGSGDSAGGLVFDMTTFAADSPAARKYVGLSGETDDGTRKQVDANMHGKDVLNVAKFPTATFQIRSALPAKAPAGSKVSYFQLDGTFTLHGVEKPLKVTCAATPVKEGWRVTTKFSVRQTDFGIKPFSKALGAIGVADELVIFGDLVIAAEQR